MRKLTKKQITELKTAEKLISNVYLKKLQKEFPVGLEVYVRNAHLVLDDPKDAIRLNSYRVVDHIPPTRVLRDYTGAIEHNRIGTVCLRHLDRTGNRVYGETISYTDWCFWHYFRKVPKKR